MVTNNEGRAVTNRAVGIDKPGFLTRERKLRWKDVCGTWGKSRRKYRKTGQRLPIVNDKGEQLYPVGTDLLTAKERDEYLNKPSPSWNQGAAAFEG
ncbi:MAG TPA: hypothetical protein VF189_01700 [Patescibacteria group bacterium]